jgi:predicted kinase
MIDTNASESVLIARLRARESDASEADVGVLRHQLKFADPMAPDERQRIVSIDTGAPAAIESCIRQIRDRSGGLFQGAAVLT